MKMAQDRGLYNDSIIVKRIILSLADIITIQTTDSSNLAKDIVKNFQSNTDTWYIDMWKKLSIFIGFFGELFKNSYVGKDLWKGRHSSSYAIYARRPLEDFISSIGILTQGGAIPLTDLNQIATAMPLDGGMRDVVNLHSIMNGQRGGGLGEVRVVFRYQNKNFSDNIAVHIDESKLYIIAERATGIQPASLFLNKVRIPPDQSFIQFLEQYGYVGQSQQGREPTSKGQSKGFDWLYTPQETKGGWSEFALIIDVVSWRQQLQIMKDDFSTAHDDEQKQRNICQYYESLWSMNLVSDTNQQPITLYDYCKDPATGGRCLLLFFLREIPTSWAPTSWVGTLDNTKSTINTCLRNAGFDPNSIIAWDRYVRLYIYIMNTTNTKFLTILKYRGITDRTDTEAELKNYLYHLYHNLGDSSPLKEYFDFLEPLLNKFREVDMGQDTNLAMRRTTYSRIS